MDVGAEKPAIVDFEDAPLLSTIKWYRSGKYVRCTSGTSIHRVIMRPPKGFEVHHRNEDPYDNRRCNLVSLPHNVHRQNHHKRDGYFGISILQGKYIAAFVDYGISFNLGTFDTVGQAAMAYDWAVRILFGPDAQVNFPEVIVPATAAWMIRQSKGRFFSVTFQKRTNGIIRILYCQIVTTPEPHRSDFAGKNLILVKSLNPHGLRAIPVEGIYYLVIDGKKYAVRQ
jgi:hypothetical protein